MTAYRRILAAIDLTQDSQVVAGRACEIARAGNASVQLLHVMEIIPIEPMSDSERMAALLLELGLPQDAGSVEAGSAKGEILRYARERHGLSILLHRTEDSVLHGAPCDVLAVRVR
jgi:universal stress protein A